MVQTHDILARVTAAQGDLRAADDLVRQYLPFIKSETAKFIHRPPMEGQDDELSIAMFAFHEAVLRYSKEKGAFLSFAALQIRSRLIDYFRKEKRHGNVISLYQQDGSDEDAPTLLEKTDTGTDDISLQQVRQATKEEILEFSAQLQQFGLSLGDIAENCPKQQRTLSACHTALDYAKKHPELLDIFLETKKLPLKQLTEGSRAERKTLERHRKYMMALLLAYTNGYEIIRGHLCQMGERREQA